MSGMTTGQLRAETLWLLETITERVGDDVVALAVLGAAADLMLTAAAEDGRERLVSTWLAELLKGRRELLRQ